MSTYYSTAKKLLAVEVAQFWLEINIYIGRFTYLSSGNVFLYKQRENDPQAQVFFSFSFSQYRPNKM
jgi:hypothetical protein